MAGLAWNLVGVFTTAVLLLAGATSITNMAKLNQAYPGSAYIVPSSSTIIGPVDRVGPWNLYWLGQLASFWVLFFSLFLILHFWILRKKCLSGVTSKYWRHGGMITFLFSGAWVVLGMAGLLGLATGIIMFFNFLLYVFAVWKWADNEEGASSKTAA